MTVNESSDFSFDSSEGRAPLFDKFQDGIVRLNKEVYSKILNGLDIREYIKTNCPDAGKEDPNQTETESQTELRQHVQASLMLELFWYFPMGLYINSLSDTLTKYQDYNLEDTQFRGLTRMALNAKLN